MPAPIALFPAFADRSAAVLSPPLYERSGSVSQTESGR